MGRGAIRTTEGEELIPLRWSTTSNCVIGMVGLIDRRFGYYKVYIGCAGAADYEADARSIAAHGAPLMQDLAAFLVKDNPLFDGLEHAT